MSEPKPQRISYIWQFDVELTDPIANAAFLPDFAADPDGTPTGMVTIPPEEHLGMVLSHIASTAWRAAGEEAGFRPWGGGLPTARRVIDGAFEEVVFPSYPVPDFMQRPEQE